MDEHLPGVVDARREARSCPTAEYRQTGGGTAKYRLVGGGTAEYRQPAGGLARGSAPGERATMGRGVYGEKVVGFASFLADRAGLSLLFSHPDSPSAPRPGMAWALRIDLDTFLEENEKPETRLSQITPYR
jgi:hypothetical protein